MLVIYILLLVKTFISSFYFERDHTSLRKLQTGCGNHAVSQSTGILVLPPWVKRHGHEVSTHHRLAARLRMSETILLLPIYAFMDKYNFVLYHYFVHQTSNCSVSRFSKSSLKQNSQFTISHKQQSTRVIQ